MTVLNLNGPSHKKHEKSRQISKFWDTSFQLQNSFMIGITSKLVMIVVAAARVNQCLVMNGIDSYHCYLVFIYKKVHVCVVFLNVLERGE